MDLITIGFTGLFIVTFLSATILPLSSELFLVLMLSKGYDPVTCLIVATVGNSLGGLTNYGIGRLGNPKWLKKTGLTDEKIEKYNGLVSKYGSWLALISWVPIIGDPLVICLGYFRVSFLKILFLVVIGKFLRYFFIVKFYL
jgi:membrane protein YqaA with SNARE-associated domain